MCITLTHFLTRWPGARPTNGISPGIILCMRSADERRSYIVTLSLNDWAHTQIYLWWRYLKWPTRSLGTSDVNSFWPSDAIWQHRIESNFMQVMACCLTPPSHYLNQFWLITSKVQSYHLMAIPQEMAQPPITKISLKMIYLKFSSNFPLAIELTCIGHAP